MAKHREALIFPLPALCSPRCLPAPLIHYHLLFNLLLCALCPVWALRCASPCYKQTKRSMDATRKFCSTDRCFARSAKLRICPAEGCKTKLNTMNSVVCSECKTKAQLQGSFSQEGCSALQTMGTCYEAVTQLRTMWEISRGLPCAMQMWTCSRCPCFRSWSHLSGNHS